MLNNFIFDLDGTIINSSKEVMICFEKAFAQANYPIDKSRLTHNIIGPPLPEIVKLIAPEIDKINLDKVVSNFHQIYDYDENDISEIYAGMYEFLCMLKQSDKRIFMATYKPDFPTQRIVRQFRLDMFDEVYTIDKFGEDITKTQMINMIIDKYGLKREETVMIGDAASDVICAREAGVRGIGVLWGYGEDKSNLINNSDTVVKTVEELEATTCDVITRKIDFVVPK